MGNIFCFYSKFKIINNNKMVKTDKYLLQNDKLGANIKLMINM